MSHARDPGRLGGRIAYAAAVAVLCVFQTWLGWQIVRDTNLDSDAFDQGSYMLLATALEGAAYPTLSDGTRNPLVPWLAALWLDTSAPDFFAAAKRFSVVLGAACTVVLAVFFRLRLGALAAFNATMLAALAVLLPGSTFFGAEPLFFTLFLLVFALALHLLNENPVPAYALLGLLAGAAWLAKPSADPFVAMFFASSLARAGLVRCKLPGWFARPGWSVRRFLIGAPCFALVFFAAISPRLLHASATWGNPFYSLPSHWFWADDWETCVEKYADCRPARLREMPPAEQPTLAGYFRRHDLAHAMRRVTEGSMLRLQQFFHPEKKWRVPYDRAGRPRRVVLPHRGFYIVGLAALAAAMCVLAWRAGKLRGLSGVGLPALLAIATFILYTAAAGWYAPIGPGHRFILILYLPALWLCMQAADSLRALCESRLANLVHMGAHLLILGLLILRAAQLLAWPVFERVLYTF